MSTNGRTTALVIDDDPYFRQWIEIAGELCHVPVLQAPNCTVGLQVLERHQQEIKVILLDYLMPGMDPPECAAAIIAKAGSSIPVVLVTAASDPAARAAELNLPRWLAKPLETAAITNVLVNG